MNNYNLFDQFHPRCPVGSKFRQANEDDIVHWWSEQQISGEGGGIVCLCQFGFLLFWWNCMFTFIFQVWFESDQCQGHMDTTAACQSCVNMSRMAAVYNEIITWASRLHVCRNMSLCVCVCGCVSVRDRDGTKEGALLWCNSAFIHRCLCVRQSSGRCCLRLTNILDSCRTCVWKTRQKQRNLDLKKKKNHTHVEYICFLLAVWTALSVNLSPSMKHFYKGSLILALHKNL